MHSFIGSGRVGSGGAVLPAASLNDMLDETHTRRGLTYAPLQADMTGQHDSLSVPLRLRHGQRQHAGNEEEGKDVEEEEEEEAAELVTLLLLLLRLAGWRRPQIISDGPVGSPPHPGTAGELRARVWGGFRPLPPLATTEASASARNRTNDKGFNVTWQRPVAPRHSRPRRTQYKQSERRTEVTRGTGRRRDSH
jgi:hypothetical protein